MINKMVCINTCEISNVTYYKDRQYTYSKLCAGGPQDYGVKTVGYAIYKLNGVYVGKIGVRFFANNFMTYEKYMDELDEVDYLFDLMFKV